jgi:hypothetical protein
MTAPTLLSLSAPNRPTLAPAVELIPEGQRNGTLFREACRLRRHGLDEDAILRRLRSLNARRCKPPLPEAELASIAHSAARYQAGEDWMTTHGPLYRELRDRPLEPLGRALAAEAARSAAGASSTCRDEPSVRAAVAEDAAKRDSWSDVRRKVVGIGPP